MTVATKFDLAAMAAACRNASRVIATTDSAKRNALLQTIADEILLQQEPILAANAKDVAAGKEKGLSKAMVDRLVLTADRLKAISDSVKEVIALPDPVGEITSGWLRPNGIQVSKVRIPLGVIAMIYESRPNVTIDAAVLCLKAGNGIILRGGSEAFHSNMAFAAVLHTAFEKQGLPPEACCLIPTTDRAVMNELLTLEESIDLVIPRGGEGLIRFVAQNSRIPVIKHYKGVCHLYVDVTAEVDMAVKLLLDGKTSRPGVCNALETLLVHGDAAASFLPVAGKALAEKGVVIKGCERTRAFIQDALPATDDDYAEEFLDLVIAVKVVDDMNEAVAHINQFGSDHTEVICTRDITSAQNFVRAIGSSVVMVNASSRFSDGGQLGLGTEIGISTTRLHAYGPMGLQALTTEKFVVMGQGQVRH